MTSVLSIGEVQTPLAVTYLKFLCKHFSTEIPVEYSETEGFAQFPFGKCRLSAKTQTLTFHCEAENTTALDRMQEVIDKHVVMFTQRNPVIVTWQTHNLTETSAH
jgi:uncharacterized protein